MTGKRPFRCAGCDWRGWGVDREAWSADDAVLLPEPSKRVPFGLARDDCRKDIDFVALDAFDLVSMKDRNSTRRSDLR